jgi:hypothetical protein
MADTPENPAAPSPTAAASPPLTPSRTEPAATEPPASPPQTPVAPPAPAAAPSSGQAAAAPGAAPAVDAVCTVSGAHEIIRSLSLAFTALITYPPAHKLTVQALDDTVACLRKHLKQARIVNFTVANGILFADGRKIEFRASLIGNLLKRCTEHGVDNFSLTDAMPQAELQTFLGMLAKPPDKSAPPGAFAQSLQSQAVSQIKVRTGKMLLVTDEEVLLPKKEFEEQLAAAKTPVEEIIAFIRGETIEAPEQAAAALKEMASDSDQLADLLLKATQIAERPAGVEDADTLESIVLGSIRRLCDNLTQSPAARTQKGKRDLQRTLMLLEEKVVERLRSLTGVTDRLVDATANLFEEARNDLQVDAIAADYLAKRRAIENAEKKVLSFLKRQGAQEQGLGGQLKEKLAEGGVSPDGWRELVVRSRSGTPGRGRGAGPGSGPGEGGASGAGAGAGPGAGPGPGGGETYVEHVQSVNTLAMLLTQLDTLINPTRQGADGRPRKDALKDVVHKVDGHLDGLVTQAEQRIEFFAEIARRIQAIEGSTREETEKLLSRREILAILAELVQELRQPLSVLSCANDMILSGWLGDLSEEQRSMISMSASSSQRLAELINKMESISGLPAGTHPNEAIRGFLYAEEPQSEAAPPPSA